VQVLALTLPLLLALAQVPALLLPLLLAQELVLV